MKLSESLLDLFSHNRLNVMFKIDTWSNFTQLIVTLWQTQSSQHASSGYLFTQPADVFNVTAKWDWNTVVIWRIGTIAGCWQLDVDIGDGACGQWCYDVADSCQPLCRGIFVGTAQQTRAATVWRMQLQRHWLTVASVHDRAITATHVAQSQGNCSLWWCRWTGRWFGIISPANVTQHWRWRLAEVRCHLT